MTKLTFRTDSCKGCGLCVGVCPKKLLELAKDVINKKGHHPVRITDQSACPVRPVISMLLEIFLLQKQRKIRIISWKSSMQNGM